MSTKLVTQKQKLHLARQLLESISEVSNSAYYVFTSNHVPRNSLSIPDIEESMYETQFEPYRNMQFGKRISSNDAIFVIRNIPYEANVIYTMYDEQDDNLLDSDYYVIVNASSYYHIFKVLDNNRGGYSTIEPNFVHISGSNTAVYQTSDGYRWKYMYSVSSTEKDKFSTDDWFPLIANTTVKEEAVGGAIDIIKIDGSGLGYHNYLSGTFSSNELKVGGNPKLYKISNNSINQTNGFYTGCLLYLSTGTGSGQYETVTNYYTNANGNFIEIEQEFEIVPTNGTTWQINPRVNIKGVGKSVVNAVARALVNAYSGNSIYRIEMLNRGSGYEYAIANVVANSVLNITVPAILRPIRSPYGGHGFDAASELGCHSLMFSVKFSNSELGTIPTNNIFQQIGVMKDPIFSDIDFVISSSNGSFLTNEPIYVINPIRIETNATVNTTSSFVTLAGADFQNQFKADDFIYLNSSNGTSHMLTKVRNVINSSTINVISNVFFSCTETIVYHANVTSNAVFSSQSNATLIRVSNGQGIFQSNNKLMGYLSGGKAVVNSVFRSGVNKDFNTFVQMHKMVGTLTSGSFTENEYIYQGNSLIDANATSILHSFELSGGILTIYTTNQLGKFKTGTIIGSQSLATATINNIYNPEINEGSGEIIFLENISPVERQDDQTETIQVTFNF